MFSKKLILQSFRLKYFLNQRNWISNYDILSVIKLNNIENC